MLKIAVVFGTRPEAIKMAPLINELKKQNAWETRVIVSGQHREMLDQVLRIFKIKPDCDLQVMRAQQSLSEITIRVLEGLNTVFRKWRPDLVLVHGDTTTALAGALAGFYWKIPIGHVEAGLRTPTIWNPFPEEANRRLIDVLSSLYFAPTERAAENLRGEGIEPGQVFVTGNTVIDALLSVVREDYLFRDPILQQLDLSKPLLIVTAHRRENWGDPLRTVCQALLAIGERCRCEIVVAMHRNPVLQEIFLGLLGQAPHIKLIEAPDYLEFANLLAKSTLLLTDSGGLQEEAPALGKPVLVLREVTERPEGVEAGTVKLVGTEKETIISSVCSLLEDKGLYAKMSKAQNPYGDGSAARRIRQIIEEKYR
ncbi:MAG: UDP-N-acetylglucosamine 2-epimerase (non-hydrolyzing) [Firmicutes bacterium]|nr:UDP-N-acetylglucosamine 2-epimerase (non-hydrolyzing) [Bacillota bacterium]